MARVKDKFLGDVDRTKKLIDISVEIYEEITEIHCLSVREEELKQIDRGEISIDNFVDDDTLESRDWGNTDYYILRRGQDNEE